VTAGLACDPASVLVALDFDGTLAPITPHPADARPLAGVHQVLRDVRATGAALAVVTGRSVSSLLRVSGFGAIPGIVIYGTHGAERWQAGSLRTAAAPPGLGELRERLPGLVAGIVRDPDVWVEDKSLSLVVHARLTAQPERVLDRLREPVEEAAAVRELLGEDRAAVLYAGDDVGDLDAMVEVNAWAERVGRPGLTVAVGAAGGPVAGVADVTVPDPEGLLDLLRRLLGVAWPAWSSGLGSWR